VLPQVSSACHDAERVLGMERAAAPQMAMLFYSDSPDMLLHELWELFPQSIAPRS